MENDFMPSVTTLLVICFAHVTHLLLYWIVCILGRWPYITNKL